jgi:hypothetical protein
MKISNSHQVFSHILSSPRALSHPDEFLGPNWKDVLNFWLYFDTLISGQIDIVNDEMQHNFDGQNSYRWVCALQVTAYSQDAFNITPPKFDFAVLELIGSHELIKTGGELKYLSRILSLVTV